MDLTKLCKIGDSAKNLTSSHLETKKDTIKDMFKDIKEDSKLLNRVSDTVVGKKLIKQTKELEKLKDALEDEKKKISALEKSLSEKEKEASSIEEYFKPELEDASKTIEKLTEAIKELQTSPALEFSYDILTEEFKYGSHKIKVEPDLAKVLASFLSKIPNSKVTSNAKVLDSLSLTEVTELQEFVNSIETAMEGNLSKLEEFDISNLPVDLLPFAKEIKEGKPYVSSAIYEEYAPTLKSYLRQEKISFPDLVLLADSKK